MKKIMFNDKYGLTEAVLAGKKTMTRRFRPSFNVGDVVAIAMSYKDVFDRGFFRTAFIVGDVRATDIGWSNKMFVRANLMPYQLKITQLKMEHLQDITEDDCLKEGISQIGVTHYGVNDVILGNTPREAFAAIIDKVGGKGTWARNPIVFAYEFELIRAYEFELIR